MGSHVLSAEGKRSAATLRDIPTSTVEYKKKMSGAMFLMLKKSSDRRQREALEAAFKKADVNGDGFLSADEYYRILKDHGIDCTYEEIMQIMQEADKDHDGKISREEFVGPERPPKKGLGTDAKAELAFNVFDKNHDGYITKNEMLRGSKNLTKGQVEAVFKQNDNNQDGKLTLEEFQEFMQHHKKEKSSHNYFSVRFVLSQNSES